MPELQNDVVDWLFHYGLAAGPTYYRNPYLPDCELDFEVGVDADQLTRPFDPGPRAEGLAPFQGFYLDLEDEHRAGPPTDDATIDVPVYAERTDEGDGGVRLTYWMLFGMHAPEGRPVRVHEGDWERVDVLLDDLGEDRYVPHTVEVGPAPIERRVRVPWSSVRRADGSHPIVQLARGSHTPLASHDRDCAGCLAWPTWQTLSNAPDEVVQALRARGLPVEIVGLGGLLSAPEVADLVALLTVAQDPTRGDALMRLLTGPVCRLGPADIDGLWAWAGALADLDGQDRGDVALADALDRLPPTTWRGSRGRRVSETARSRVQALGQAVERVRTLAGLPLPELLTEAERAIGLDLEVTSDPDLPPAWGRAQLDALAEVAANFAVSAERPTLGGFVAWLEAARERERGLEMAEVTVSESAVQVLTVHAAKGLEWDVVAVPGLAEGTFPSYTTQTSVTETGWRARTPKDKGWMTGIGKLPYPLRGDVAGLPALPLESVADTHELRDALGSFALAGGRHQLQEERRLAYVAFTRARHDLLVTAPVWSTGQTPRETSRFLTELIDSVGGEVALDRWEAMPDPDDPQQCLNPLRAEEQLAPWPVVPDARRRLVSEVVQAVVDARRAGELTPVGPDDPVGQEVDRLLRERDELRAARSGGLPTDLPPHLSTSGLVALSADRDTYLRDLRRPVPRPPAHAARAGTSFHAWVERHYGMPSLVDLDDLLTDTDHDVVDLSRMRAHFLASEWAGRQPVEIEVSVETVIGGRAVRGRIDAVFAEGDGFVIVDWKTGSRGSGAQEEARVLQLAVYRVAYARLRGVPPEAVSAAFFYAASGETVRPELPSERDLEALVARLAAPTSAGLRTPAGLAPRTAGQRSESGDSRSVASGMP